MWLKNALDCAVVITTTLDVRRVVVNVHASSTTTPHLQNMLQQSAARACQACLCSKLVPHTQDSMPKQKHDRASLCRSKVANHHVTDNSAGCSADMTTEPAFGMSSKRISTH
jgi:hypothetical protein